MGDSGLKAKKRAYELRERAANAEKAEIELESARLRLAVNRSDFDETMRYSPDETGKFHFVADVNESTSYNFGKRIRLFADRHPGHDIEVTITTRGGEPFAGLGLYDDLRTLSAAGHRITTRVRGWAASFGVVMLQAGDTRLLGAESHLMVHELSTVALGKLHEIKNEADFSERMNRRLFDILAERSGGKWTGRRLYTHVKGKDLWLDAREAIDKYGLADGIG